MRDIVLPESFGGLHSQHTECKFSQTEPNWTKQSKCERSVSTVYYPWSICTLEVNTQSRSWGDEELFE